MNTFKSFGIFAALTASVAVCGIAQAQPNPILYLKSFEPVTIRGQNFIRYFYDVLNRDQYPAALFAAAPNLPPCGNNTSASRAWVDLFAAGTNRRLNEFCALGTASNLNGIWFALPEGEIPPSYIYIEINDRQTNTKFRSNLADTVM
jgi:hypothetical protein